MQPSNKSPRTSMSYGAFLPPTSVLAAGSSLLYRDYVTHSLCVAHSLSCARSTHFRADGEQVTRQGIHFLKLLCTQAWIRRPQWPVVPEAYSFPRQGDAAVTSYWHWLLDVYIVNICNLKRYRFQNSWWTCGCWWINVLWYLPLMMQKTGKMKSSKHGTF